MPPHDPRQDPNVISVQLALLGGQSQNAVTELTRALDQLNTHLQTAGSLSSAVQATGASAVLQTKERQTQVRETTGGPSTPDIAAQQAHPAPTLGPASAGPQQPSQAPTMHGTPSGAGDGVVQVHEKRFRDKLGLLHGRWAATQGASWTRQQADPEDPKSRGYTGRGGELADLALSMARPPGHRGDPEADYYEASGQHPVNPSHRGGGPSRPPGGGPPAHPGGPRGAHGEPGGDRSWERHFDRGQLEDQVRWPRFGELTGQDKLQMAADWLGRSQLRSNDRNPDANQWRGRAAAGLAIAANNYTQIRAAREEMKRATAWVGVSRQSQAQYADMGFDPTGATAGGDEFGGQIPFVGPLTSEAGREGIKRRVLHTRLRAMPRLGGEEADAIINSLEGEGYSGEDRDQLAYNYMAPIMRDEGGTAEPLAKLADQAYRHGNASIEELRDAVSGLGETARTTRQSLDEVRTSLGAYSEQAQEQGATAMQGIRAGREYSQASGMKAEVGGAVLNNPMAQGLAMTRMGMLPGQMGLMGGEQVASLQSQTVDLAMQMTTGFARPGQDTVLKDKSGRVLGVREGASARDMQIAQAAQLAGMPVEEFKATLKNRDQIEASGRATAAIGQYEKQFSRAKKSGGEYTDAERDQLRRGKGDTVNWHETAQTLREAGVSEKRIKKITAMDDEKGRIREAKKAVSQAQRGDAEKDKQKIGLTKQAARFFKLISGNPGGAIGDTIRDEAGKGISSINKIAGEINPGFGGDALNAIGGLLDGDD